MMNGKYCFTCIENCPSTGSRFQGNLVSGDFYGGSVGNFTNLRAAENPFLMDRGSCLLLHHRHVVALDRTVYINVIQEIRAIEALTSMGLHN
jgi:hypothetical protein